MQTVEPLLVESFFPPGKDMIHLSPVCDFSLVQDGNVPQEKTVILTVSYSDTVYRPRIYTWDSGAKRWNGMVSTINRKEHTVSSDVPVNASIFGVFADGRNAYEGIASWYAHKRYPAGSATNLFPIGTQLKVTNTANNKSTTVTVTSTWTNKNEKRIIDLVSTAFKKIAALSAGLVPIRIERL
jgi:rare lipoprotein A (peptidoglycan hydrolase)